jgi:hypothetical protein
MPAVARPNCVPKPPGAIEIDLTNVLGITATRPPK